MKYFKKHKKLKIAFIFILLLFAFRLYLPTLAKIYINKELNKDPIYHGSVAEIKIQLWKGSYTIIGLNIVRAEGQKSYPFLAAEQIEIGLSWQELLHRSVAAQIDVNSFEINFVQEKEKNTEKGAKKDVVGAPSKEGKKKEAHTWQSVFKDLVPLDVGKLKLTDGKIHFRDLTSSPEVDVYLDQVKVRGENLTNSTRLSKSLFGKIQMNARAMKSGNLDMNLYINPLSTPLEFKLDIQISHLDLVNLNRFFTAYGKFDVKKGEFSLYSEIATAHKKIEGYFKPVITNLQVTDFSKDRDKSLGHAIWEQIIGAVGSIFKNHPKDQQAAKIPFSGNMDDIHFDVWATFTSILENLFIKPIAPHLENSIKLTDLQKGKTK